MVVIKGADPSGRFDYMIQGAEGITMALDR
jgi:hypothetical protein